MEAGEMAQQLQTSTSSPTTSVQTTELITVERTDFHKLPTTSTGILLHTHAFMYAHRIIVIIINKIIINSNNPRSPPQTTGPFNVTNILFLISYGLPQMGKKTISTSNYVTINSLSLK